MFQTRACEPVVLTRGAFVCSRALEARPSPSFVVSSFLCDVHLDTSNFGSRNKRPSTHHISSNFVLFFDVTSQTASRSAVRHNSGHHSQTKSSQTSTKVETETTRDATTTTQWVGALMAHSLAWMGHHSSWVQARTLTVHHCPCEGRPWVAQSTSVRATVAQDSNMQRA